METNTTERNEGFEVKAGSVTVPVYHRSREVRGKVYDEFTVSFYDEAGERVRRRFGSAADARAEAERIALTLSRGQAAEASLGVQEAAELTRAAAMVAPLNLSICAALSELLTARALLPSGHTLVEVCRNFSTAYHKNDPRKVSEIVAELIAAKERAGFSGLYKKLLTHCLGKFGQAFQCPLADVSAKSVQRFLDGLTVDGGTRPARPVTVANFRRMIVTLYNYSASSQRRYIPRDLAKDVGEIPSPREGFREVHVFTPAQVQALLDAAVKHEDEELVAALAISAFAGLRSAELDRLNWSDVQLAQGVIRLSGEKSKTGRRRVIPVQPNLAGWLSPRVKASGRVNPTDSAGTLGMRMLRIAKRAKVPWVRNGLRHSFCSYRFAVLSDASKVATEAGNSVAIIHEHYKALVTEAEGAAWFAVVPSGTPTNVVPFASGTEG